jgi:cytochrome P450
VKQIVDDQFSGVAVAPGRIPVIGHLVRLAHRPLDFLRSLSTLGDIVRVDLANVPVYFLTDAELVRTVLTSQSSKFERGRFFERSKRLFGEGLSVSDGEIHRRQRKLMRPAFHSARIADYAAIMRQCVQDMTAAWSPHQTVAIDQAMRSLTLTVIAETMFSAPMGRPAIEAAHRCLPIIMANTLPRTVLPPALDNWPLPVNRRFGAASATLRNVIDQVVQDYRTHGVDNGDLLSLLMAARDAETGAAMSDRQVLDEALNIMVAGTETTATTLSWAFHHLASHSEAQDRLHMELGDASPSEEGILQVPYLDRVLNEVTRLYSVMLLTRRPTVNVRLAQVEMPAGVELAYSPYALHRDERYFPRPDNFDPDRWLPGNGADNSHAFLPFGLGRHRCLGERFAWLEMTLTLATVFSEWEIAPLPGHPVREKLAAIPQPDELLVTVRRRGRRPE